jgi:hypothetical protein
LREPLVVRDRPSSLISGRNGQISSIDALLVAAAAVATSILLD